MTPLSTITSLCYLFFKRRTYETTEVAEKDSVSSKKQI